jgi:nitrogen fixation protein NifU and related proteins
MTNDAVTELYQQMILEHNKKPRNFGRLSDATHQAEGFNPLCGDHYSVYIKVEDGIVRTVYFDGSGCAISKASASMMTGALKDKKIEEAQSMFRDFHNLLMGKIADDSIPASLGKLKIFSGIWKYPSRVKCASLSWHAMNAALSGGQTVSTE